MPPVLDLQDAVTIVTGIVILTGVVWSQRMATARLESGQGEVLRQVQAIHKRMDDYGKRLQRAETAHAVLVERVENLRGTARFKAQQGEVPLFKDDE